MVLAADGRGAEAERAYDAAIAALAKLDERELAEHLEALWYLAWAETFTDRFESAVEYARRGLELSRATGQERLVVPLMLAAVFPLEMLCRITEAVDVGAAAVDAARLSGNPHHLSWALWEYGLVCWYGGDSGGARVALAESQRARRRDRAQHPLGGDARLGAVQRAGLRRRARRQQGAHAARVRRPGDAARGARPSAASPGI